MDKLFVSLEFDINAEKVTRLKTNVKDVNQFLFDYIHSIIGAGSDKTVPIMKNTYSIIIVLDTNMDVFTVRSDTNNNALTAGIIMGIIANNLISGENDGQD